MVGLVIGIIVLAIGVINALREKNGYNLLTVFCAYWASAMIIASFRPYEMYEVSFDTYLVILLGVAGFSIGYLYRHSKQYRKIVFRRDKSNINNTSYEFKKLPLTILALISAAYGLFKAFCVFRLVNSGLAYSTVRSLYGAGDSQIIFGTLDNIVNVFVYTPAVFILTAVMVIDFFEKKTDVKIFIMSVVTLLTYMYISSGRFILLAIVADVIYMFIIYKSGKILREKLKKIKRKVWIIISISVIAVLVITSSRFSASFESRNVSTSSHFLLYYMGCVPLMGHWLGGIRSAGDMTYGMASGHGFLHPLILLGKMAGINAPKLYTYTTDVVESMQNFVFVTPTRALNAFSGIFLYLYLDARELGVFLGMFVYGVICANSFKQVQENRNAKTMLYFLLIMQGFTQVMVRWPFYRGPYAIAFVYALALIRKGADYEN